MYLHFSFTTLIETGTRLNYVHHSGFIIGRLSLNANCDPSVIFILELSESARKTDVLTIVRKRETASSCFLVRLFNTLCIKKH